MGKSSLIIVLGMSVIIGFFILKLNANSTENMSVTSNMFQKTQARLMANSGVEIYLEKLKHDRSLVDDSPFLGNNLFGGTYDVYIEDTNDLIQVTSVASFMGVSHTTVVEASAELLPLNYPPGAMYLSSGTVAGLKKNAINGSIEINGKDHDLSGNLLPAAPVLPGIAVDGVVQQTAVIGMIQKNHINNVVGSGGVPSVVVVNNAIDWTEYAQLLADNADILINSQESMYGSLSNNGSWGTTDNPKVTFINGDIHLTNSSTARGCGILIVNGNLSISGTIEFKGLVIAYKDTQIGLNLSGNGLILGGLVVAGNQINVDVQAGNFDLLYSKPALDLVQNLLKTNRFNVLSWWE